LYNLIREDFESVKDKINPLEDYYRFKLSALIEEINENAERDATGEKIKYLKIAFLTY